MKEQNVRNIFHLQGIELPSAIKFATLPDRGLRDRLDFQFRGEKLGLWDHSRKEILDLPECLQLSSELQAWLDEFRQIKRPIERGSLRLRVSPSGQRGVWLDLANEDVKTLFTEKLFLFELTQKARVEIGQRRKAFLFEEGVEGQGQVPKLLKEPRFFPWNRTWLGEKPFLLFSRIADFSQVGDQANRMLIESLMQILTSGKKLIEFGSGSGNLSFPAFEIFDEMVCYEFDESVALGFEKSRIQFEELFPDKKGNLTLHLGDFQKNKASLLGADTVLLNPPRSGIGNFLSELAGSSVEHLIYMSCYPESLARDFAPLKEQWHCEKMILVDQFPQTDHVEVLSRWSRR